MNRPEPSLAILRLVVFVGLLASAGVSLLVLGTDEMIVLLETAADSRWGMLAFFVVYIIGVVLLVPGTVGTVTAGAVFGFGVGFPLALASATVGATIAFVVSRSLGREGSRQLVGHRLVSIDEWLGQNDFISIFTLRLMPIVPFNGLNYAAGLTGARLSRYAAATALGMLPGTALVTFASSRARDASSMSFLLASTALLATVVVSSVAARRLSGRRRNTSAVEDRQ
jgi:uncharacterized membrane protein YdjX (TVP38/TMEM64 family)